MKSFALAALVAIVSAETNVECAKPEGGVWTADVLTATDSANCYTVCKADATDAEKDYCCEAVTTTTPAEGDAAESKATVCTLNSAPKGADDIRKVKAATATVAYDAWAKDAGVELADLVAKDADSAKIITSAIATFAALAMAAY